mmetsp:Transcript_31353/g.55119  ORF Transcript_31353/g.55119 Transcript_31353/m.55119 type:complete len:200 (-) Transcript_31353:17-616(-)
MALLGSSFSWLTVSGDKNFKISYSKSPSFSLPLMTSLENFERSILGNETSHLKSWSPEYTFVRYMLFRCGELSACSYMLAPPMTNTELSLLVWFCITLSVSRAPSKLPHTMTSFFSFASPLNRSLLRVTTQLRRPGRGLNFFGMESQVFRPITTALMRLDLGGTSEVNSLKNFISPRSLHGRVPFLPIPKVWLSAATTT